MSTSAFTSRYSKRLSRPATDRCLTDAPTEDLAKDINKARRIMRRGIWKAGAPGSSRVRVFLDGEPMPLAIEADVKLGRVVVRATGLAGSIIRDETTPLEGRVELVGVDE